MDNFIQREEFRQYFRDQRDDFREALKEAIEPIVKRLDHQNGKVDKHEIRLSALEQNIDRYEDRAKMASKAASIGIKLIWGIFGAGILKLAEQVIKASQ